VSCRFSCRCNHYSFNVLPSVLAASQFIMAPTLREFLVKVGEGREDAFINEVIAIFTENQVMVLRDLQKFKFEYVAWPDQVSGMKKAFVCEVLEAWAEANPVEKKQPVASEAGHAMGDELRLVCTCSVGVFGMLPVCLAGSRTRT
jgi:hypothetical protein